MLNMHAKASPKTGSRNVKPFWLDLFDPTPDDVAKAEAESGVKIPSRASLEEIESSSRLRAQGDVLFVSMPLAIEDPAAGLVPLPLGFVLSPRWLITVRFAAMPAFDQVDARVAAGELTDGISVFAALIEGMVDFGADMLEKLSSDLAKISELAFRPRSRSRRDQRASRSLQDCLNGVGIAGDHSSRVRQSLLGLQRIIGYVLQTDDKNLTPELKTRLNTARQDLVSLVDFEAHVSAKTQFLLDAILGFINTEQNDIFRVLTVVSVVGIPPTLVASIYGMNFQHMPELAWRWGYPYGLAVIVLSALVPVAWFKFRGWW
jgi:magnesium transporter